MMDALWGSLTEAELSLVREVEEDRLAGMDEDALIELHTRVRRARNRYVKVYRRQAAALIAPAGGRGKAGPRNTRSRAKAAAFEQALASVSQHLAAKAQASAEALQAEQPADAGQPGDAVTKAGAPVPQLRSQRTDRRPDPAGLRKRQASTRAVGARRQARRDSR
jgi:hypothetical protein